MAIIIVIKSRILFMINFVMALGIGINGMTVAMINWNMAITIRIG